MQKLSILALTLMMAFPMIGYTADDLTEKQGRHSKQDLKTNNAQQAKPKCQEFRKVPPYFQNAFEYLKLPETLRGEITQAYNKYQQYLEKLEADHAAQQIVLENNRLKAYRTKKNGDIHDANQALSEQQSEYHRMRNKADEAFRRKVISLLPPKQRMLWPALELSGKAMGPFRRSLTEQQVQQVNELCIEKAAQVARIRTSQDLYLLQIELMEKIYSDVLTKEQQEMYFREKNYWYLKPEARLARTPPRPEKVPANREQSVTENKKPARKTSQTSVSKQGVSTDGGAGGW